ncbi:thioesterase II family protein [Nocardia bovistercoris]|uniref:Thioesterase TesA n=1 Tax=Nocardia bovistercoris TaxID=2785916 RepID=A0A931IBP8_9NOCA|nr:alpha/beta fold hydrolase [Nocardia bovistercoris]MBH0777631.1 thioesterase [Nocardia bovistercoris]
MQHGPRWIRKFHKPESPDQPPLLIFPHAGAGASAYRTLSKAFSKNFDVVVFQYPGRQDRAGEPGLTTLSEIAAGAFEEFRTSEHNRGVPLVTFGHSMGALVSFEFVRLAEADGIDVRQLTISAAVAPCHVADKPRHPTEDEEILSHLGMLEGTDADVFADREVMRLALPVIKRDYQAFDDYSCPDTVRVAARIQAICGDQDPIVTMRDLYAWGKHSDSVEVTMFDGGHFYLNHHVDAVAELLAPAAQRERTA